MKNKAVLGKCFSNIFFLFFEKTKKLITYSVTLRVLSTFYIVLDSERSKNPYYKYRYSQRYFEICT